ncbi:MAG TPA: nucleotidyl transferase AbiEii/AbiGii toxin family protein [Bacteroidia bacterium]|nr:nucleotidyl transferase AbiEii/AbiGii toxin family protein [Bacteroidia bacterium]
MKPIFDELEKAFIEIGIDFYLIGAVARDIWSTGVHGEKLGRITRDLDFAVLIAEKEGYTKLRSLLIETGNFSEVKENAFALLYQGKITVDLLPFGEEIEVDGIVSIEGKGLTQISVEGFSEVLEEATTEIEFAQGNLFKVCTLPGIVVLKLIAHNDRPDERAKDIQDIARIIEKYYDFKYENILDDHYDLLDADPYDRLIISARVIGRDMRSILERSENLKKRICTILETACADPEKSRIGLLMISDEITSLARAVKLLEEILKGINDKPDEI